MPTAQCACVADLMHLLADVGLTNREACYNTVRNLTACAWAGIAHDEIFDVRPYAQRLAYAFLGQDLTHTPAISASPRP
jgi:sulfite reductase beta subunit-like hemoprotein